jgi:acetyltransferase-like isoleucine patch superfamily enzyme
MDCAKSCSSSAGRTNPRGIHIGTYSVITLGAAILTHDYVNQLNRDVHIGNSCFIGACEHSARRHNWR